MNQAGSNRKSFCLFLALFLTLVQTRGVSVQQPSSQMEQQEKLLDTKVPEFEMHKETLLDGLWKLARVPVAFGFGFESVLKRRLSDPDIPDPHFSLQLKNKTVREILETLCRADGRFTWSLDGETVNVFPRATINDASYLLNRKLQKFELTNATDVDDGLLAISHQLPPPIEQVAHVQVSGDDPYPPEPWTVTYRNLTVRQIVNRIAEHGGPCGTWTFGGSTDFRRFAFFNNQLCSPKKSPAWIQKIIESRPKNP